MAENNKSSGAKEGSCAFAVAQENVVVSKEKIEGCFAHVINTIDNNEVAKGLRYCGLLCNAAWESLRQVLTTYRMSCLIIRIVLCMDNADFEKLCGYIDNHEQNKHLSELYYGYQLLLVSCESVKESSESCTYNFSLGYSLINFQFIHLTQQIQTMIKNPTLLLEDCKRLMASKIYVTYLFESDYLKGFYAIIDKPAVLFQALGVFWTWSDHSILKELLHMGHHADALSLLDKFDRYLENFKSIPIEKFPLPILSSRMIPLDINKHAHTILAIKYKSPCSKCTWHSISKVCNSLKDIFGITRNAIQFLGVVNIHSEFTLIYLMIPTSVVSLITPKITHFDYYSRLCKNNITEVAIYPKALFSADTSIRIGPLALFMDIPVNPSKHAVKEPDSVVSCLSRTEELPEIVQILISKLNDSRTQLTHAASKKSTEEKDTNVEMVLKENTDLQNTISRLEEEVKTLQENKPDYTKKIAANCKQLQMELLQNKELLKKHEERIQMLQQEKIDLLQSSEEYERKIQIMQQEKENDKLEFKASMESQREELSDLQSQIMMKTAQNQMLSEKNSSLTKHINKLREKEKAERSKVEEENKKFIMESSQLKSKNSELLTDILVLTNNNQTLSKELQNFKDERDNEIKLLNEYADKIRTQNSNLIAENENLNSDKMLLQQELEEIHKKAHLYQQQTKQLKADKLQLSKSNHSLNQKLTQCKKEKNKFSEAAYCSSESAKFANTAVSLICKPKSSQQRVKRSRSLSLSETTPEVVSYDDNSSSSVTSLSTKTTEEESEETIFPNQAQDSLEDNEK